nr:reverse transcriptase domain-containing protein [Tanacetum cinerariifolium]
MVNQRTMAQLIQAPTEGYEDAIVVPAITADNFKLKHCLLTLVQNKQFFGHDKEDLHAHGAARIWLEKEPPRSIFTWDDLVSKFINQFFPPSKTTNLRNEITNFKQRSDESFSEAWDRFKDLLRDYQDSLNSAAGGNFLDKILRECLAIIESKSKVHYSCNKPVVTKVSTNTSTSGITPNVAKLKDMVKALLLDKKSQNQAPATVKAVEESCITCGGAHSYRNYPASDGNVYPPQTQGVSKEDFSAYVKDNDAGMRNMQNQGQKMQNQLTNLTELITNDLKAITTRSGVSYNGPQIPPSTSFLPKVVENEPEATKDIMQPTNNGSTKDVQPQVVQSESTSEPVNSPISKPIAYPLSLLDLTPMCMTLELADRSISRPIGVAEDVHVKVGSFHIPADFAVVDFDADPQVPLILGRSFLKIRSALVDVFEGKLTLRAGKEAITFNLDQTSRYSANYMTTKRIDFIDMACEKYSQDVLGFSDVILIGNPTSYYDPIVSTTSPTLTPFENSDFLLEEVDTFLAIEDDPTSPEVDQSYLDPEGDILILEAFLNDDPSLPLLT